MTTVIRADAGQDFLALLPRLTGYQPRNSVILVGFRGKRTCGAIRFDLPSAAPAAVLRRLATSMIGILCRIPDVDAVVPVAYTDARFDGGSAIPEAGFLDVLVHRAEVSGFLVRDALCVAADGWASYLDPEPPIGGRPLSDIAASRVNDVADAEGILVRGGISDGTDLPSVDLARSERVARRLQALRDGSCRLGASSRTRPAPADDTDDLSLPDFLEAVLGTDPGDLSVDVIADLLRLVERPALRDVAILQWAFGPATGRTALAEQLGGVDEASESDGGTGLLLWGEGPRPDPVRLDRAIAVLRASAGAAPRSARPGPLTMLGWFSWALGQSSRAAVFVDAALEIDPEYGLAGLVRAMIVGGRLPEWAFEVPPVSDRSADR
ncbi:MAG: DUF4192 family protein [Leifsonia sp.]